jgi:hypothetical protein
MAGLPSVLSPLADSALAYVDSLGREKPANLSRAWFAYQIKTFAAQQIAAASSSPERERQALDAIWERVNALGGWAAEGSAVEQARVEAVNEVLSIIEEAGGMDPLRRRAEGRS